MLCTHTPTHTHTHTDTHEHTHRYGAARKRNTRTHTHDLRCTVWVRVCSTTWKQGRGVGVFRVCMCVHCSGLEWNCCCYVRRMQAVSNVSRVYVCGHGTTLFKSPPTATPPPICCAYACASLEGLLGTPTRNNLCVCVCARAPQFVRARRLVPQNPMVHSKTNWFYIIPAFVCTM